MNTYTSHVPNFTGQCTDVWLNTNQIDLRTNSVPEFTGFFRLTKKNWLGRLKPYGKEFHGYLGDDNIVRTTEGR